MASHNIKVHADFFLFWLRCYSAPANSVGCIYLDDGETLNHIIHLKI